MDKADIADVSVWHEWPTEGAIPEFTDGPSLQQASNSVFWDVVAVHLNIAAYAIVFCQDAAGFVWQLQLAHARRQEL